MSMFRKKALAKMSSPERIDELVQVTSPLGWLAIATVGVLLAGVIIWAILGTIPTRVSGGGILAAGDYYFVTATARGQLVELRVAEGDLVLPGQLLAVVSEPNAEARTREECDIASAKRGRYQEERGRVYASEAEWEGETSDLERQIERNDDEISRLRSKLNDPKYPRVRTEREIASLGDQNDRLRNQINSKRQAKRIAQRQVEDLRVDADLAAERCRAAEGMATLVQYVKASVGCRVVSVSVKPGDTVQREQTILRCLRQYDDLVARFYVNSQEGAGIKAGMPVEVSPASVKKEEHGFLRGAVSAISKETLTQAELMNELGQDDTRVREIMRMGPVYSVTGTLGTWSSGNGPTAPLVPNEPIRVNVITEERAPYTLVIPFTKKMLGVS